MVRTLYPGGGDSIEERMRQMMDRLTTTESYGAGGGWLPSVDIYETEDAVVLVAELAGVDRGQLKVMIDSDVVRLYGHRERSWQAHRAKFHRMEIESGSFVRHFRIGVPFHAERVTAKTQDGLLTVILPKIASVPR